MAGAGAFPRPVGGVPRCGCWPWNTLHRRPGSSPLASDHGRYRRFVDDTLKHRIPVILRNTEAGLDGETVARIRSISRVIERDAPLVVDLAGWPFSGWERLPARVNGK